MTNITKKLLRKKTGTAMIGLNTYTFRPKIIFRDSTIKNNFAIEK